MTGFIGVVVQMSGCVLLAALFALLRRHAPRRRYFAFWARAWLACAVALLALVVRWHLLPAAHVIAAADDQLSVRALYFSYQTGKLLYLGLLAAGTVTYVRGIATRAPGRIATLGAGAFALVSAAVATHFNDLVVLQTPIAVAILAWCARAFLALRPSRRTLGTRATGWVLLAMAALWTLYLPAFGWSHLGAPPAALRIVVLYNSYFDLLLQMLLGHGMLLLLMEDAKREVDDAHTELAVAHDELRRATLYDPLTGALNRMAFVEGVGLEAARAGFGSVVVIDLDNLKRVNDAHGHAAGDELLRRLVATLRETLRPSDRIFRWGGDEFLLVLPGARADVVVARVEEVIAGAMPIELAGDALLHLEASAGAAEYQDAEGLEGAILRADAAMYARKREGRARRERTLQTAG